MKLKTLLIAVLALAGLSVVVHFATRPAPRVASDPRIGQPLLPADVAANATRVTLSEKGNTVILSRDDADRWTVSSYHDFPADFTKLSRLIRELTATEVDRFVTANPERLDRLDLSDTKISLAGADEQVLWTVTLGKTADNGGRFLRFGDDDRAYLARLNTFLDTTAKNWADSALVSVKPADIAKVELTFAGDEAPVVATRADATAPFTAEQAPENQRLKSDRITTLLTTLTGLRFIDTAPFDSTDAVDARTHARTATLTTFDGQTVTISLGRRPAAEAPVPETTDDATPADSDQPAAEATPPQDVPAGPVFVQISTTQPDAWTTKVGDRLAFKISDYPFTNLPQSRADLFEAVPPSPAAEPAAEPAAP